MSEFLHVLMVGFAIIGAGMVPVVITIAVARYRARRREDRLSFLGVPTGSLTGWDATLEYGDHEGGIFDRDTLDASVALEHNRRDHEEFMREIQMAEERRHRAEQRARREKRWAWLPWSKYRRRRAAELRWQVSQLEDELKLARWRAAQYRRLAMDHVDWMGSGLLEQIKNIDDTIAVVFETPRAHATDPSPADDDIPANAYEDLLQ